MKVISEMKRTKPVSAIGRRLTCLKYFLFTDIDNTLIGEDNTSLKELIRILRENREVLGFGVATGRSIESATAHLKTHGVPAPDIVITSVGSEIYYGPHLQYEKGWETHISNQWNREKIFSLLKDFSFLSYQEKEAQRPFKISYDMEPGKDRLPQIHNLLLRNRCRYNLIYSHQKYLDILPYRASKGKAIRYLSYKWEIPLSHFLVCGDSGNDAEMLKGEPYAGVVGNYSKELEPLRGGRRIFFSKKPCAGGILEAMKRFNFIKKTEGETRCQ